MLYVLRHSLLFSFCVAACPCPPPVPLGKSGTPSSRYRTMHRLSLDCSLFGFRRFAFLFFFSLPSLSFRFRVLNAVYLMKPLCARRRESAAPKRVACSIAESIRVHVRTRLSSCSVLVPCGCAKRWESVANATLPPLFPLLSVTFVDFPSPQQKKLLQTKQTTVVCRPPLCVSASDLCSAIFRLPVCTLRVFRGLSHSRMACAVV